MKKTALTQLIEQLQEQKDRVPVEAYQKGLEYAIQAAKSKLETEREQIEEAYDKGFGKFKPSERSGDIISDTLQYYNETFNQNK